MTDIKNVQTSACTFVDVMRSNFTASYGVRQQNQPDFCTKLSDFALFSEIRPAEKKKITAEAVIENDCEGNQYWGGKCVPAFAAGFADRQQGEGFSARGG